MTRDHDEIAAIAAALPDDRPALLDAGFDALCALDQAIRSNLADEAAAAHNRFEAALWKANGGTHHGCRCPESPGAELLRYCAASPGAVPMWFQSGEFLLEEGGVRALVSVSDGFGLGQVHAEFRAVTAADPFISDTGYRSHFFDSARYMGATLYEAIRAEFAGIRADQGVGPIAPEWRARHGLDERPDWLGGAVEPVAAYEDRGGQMAMAF